MDLKCQINGDNKHHIRMLNETMGIETSIVSSFDSSDILSIWCSNDTPPNGYNVWWQNSAFGSVDKMVLYAKKQFELYSFVNMIVMEHTSQSVDNITFFVVVSKDNIVRTFQNVKDLCLYFKELVIKTL